MSERLKKLNDLLRDEVGKILLDELRLKDGVLVTTMSAGISPTLEHATVNISVYPKKESKDVLKLIGEKIFFIQQRLNKRLAMRPVPKIRFEIDDTEERAEKIEKLLKKVVE